MSFLDDDLTSQIQACQWLFLRSLDEPEDNALRIVIEEAKTADKTDSNAVAARAAASENFPALANILQGASLITHSKDCRAFVLNWERYIAYSVRNESYVKSDPYAVFEGRLFVKYTKSRFLDYVSLSTFATSDYPGEYFHWGIACGNHIIDVISTEAPVIRLLPIG
jgi:hypothetical protein